MQSLATIRQALKTSLETVLDGRAMVYSYYENNPQNYPCVIFDISNQQGDFLTDAENLHSITFQAILQVKFGTALDEEQATTKLDELADIITAQLESDWSLGSTVDFCTPVVGQRELVEIPNGTAKAQYINIVVKYTSVV
jgi:hypothetical protein